MSNNPLKEIKIKLIIEPTKYNSDLKSNMAYRSLSVIILFKILLTLILIGMSIL